MQMKLFNKVAGLKRKRFASHFFVIFLICVFSVEGWAAGTAKNYDQRITRIERLLNNQNLLEMLTLLKSLQREVSDLRGEMELLGHNLGELKKQQKDIYLDLDQRIIDLDKKIASGVAGVSPQVPQLDDNQNPDNAQQALNEQEGYQSALAILKEGRYEEAIEAFQIYLISYPASDYAANAQYWMAEAYYVIKDYESATSHFNKVISAYPESRKVPDAYLKMGFSFYELQQWPNAQRALEKVMTDYSASTAARLAQRRLEKMRQEGQLTAG